MNNNRREFIRLAGMASLALGNTGMKQSCTKSKSGNQIQEIKFISPIDGDMLCEYDGNQADGCLIIKLGSKLRNKE
jgi:hypothetical protein